MLCAQCDTRNEQNARFCTHCGAALATPVNATARLSPQRPQYTFSDVPPTGATCPACTRTNPVGARYCVYCATPLNGQPRAAGPVIALQPAYVGVPQQPMVLTFGVSANLILRALWFFFVGWWLGLVWTFFAWLFNLTLIGLPVGVTMLNMIPQVMTLRPRSSLQAQILPGGTVLVQRPAEHAFPIRALWFVFIGWWASLLWMLMAWAFSATILLLPIAFWMFERVPTITTLAAE